MSNILFPFESVIKLKLTDPFCISSGRLFLKKFKIILGAMFTAEFKS